MIAITIPASTAMQVMACVQIQNGDIAGKGSRRGAARAVRSPRA